MATAKSCDHFAFDRLTRQGPKASEGFRSSEDWGTSRLLLPLRASSIHHRAIQYVLDDIEALPAEQGLRQ